MSDAGYQKATNVRFLHNVKLITFFSVKYSKKWKSIKVECSSNSRSWDMYCEADNINYWFLQGSLREFSQDFSQRFLLGIPPRFKGFPRKVYRASTKISPISLYRISRGVHSGDSPKIFLAVAPYSKLLFGCDDRSFQPVLPGKCYNIYKMAVFSHPCFLATVIQYLGLTVTR